MSALTSQLDELLAKVDQAWEMLKLDEVGGRVKQLQAQMAAPNFWNDQERARDISQNAADLSSQYNQWDELKTQLQDARDLEVLAHEEQNKAVLKEVTLTVHELKARYDRMELQTLLSDKMDTNNAIVSIHAGAGGTDAMDWAAMLFRMYARFVESRGWTLEVLEESRNEEAGYKRVTFAVRGRFAYGYLKAEAGVHRLVRISPFDAEKMRHTAFALVEVIPELDDVSDKEISIDDKDLRIDTFMASGKGGQSVNTTYSAIRITHIPTGLVVSCQNERSQRQHKETAMRVLKSRLFQKMLLERAEKIEELKGGHQAPQWGNQIRSYVLHPYKMVKDHRTGEETQDVDGVLGGNVDTFLEAYLRHQLTIENES